MSEHKIKETFLSGHDSRPDGVYLVEAYDISGRVRFGVFSEIGKAKAWMGTFPGHVKCVCVPFLVDVPEEEIGVVQ